MTPDSVGPLSRPFSVARLPARGAEVTVEATPAERGALARDFGLPGIESLTAHLRVAETRGGVVVTGSVEADVVQTCVVTLEDFASTLREEVEVEFRHPAAVRPGKPTEEEVEADLDAPDELVDDRIDLGAITAEFLALGLDPYPRKPEVAFSDVEGASADEADTPFAALAKLRNEEG